MDGVLVIKYIVLLEHWKFILIETSNGFPGTHGLSQDIPLLGKNSIRVKI